MPDQDTWIRERIRDYAAKKRLTLTPAAFEMIALPLEEAKERGNFNRDEVVSSIRTIMEAMGARGSPALPDPSQRTAQDVVRAFFEKFCNIPPICDRKGRGD